MRSRRQVVRAATGHNNEAAPSALGSSLRLAAAGILASGLLCMSPASSLADVQTVSPQLVTQMARPLPKQTVDKGKVWTVFIGGAVVLFFGTLVVENNPKFFPAISRANQAMKEATKRMEEAEAREKKEAELLALRQQEYDAEQRQVAAVEAGLKQARQKVLGSSSSSQQQQPAAAPAAAAATAAPVAPPAQAAAPAAPPPAAHAPEAAPAAEPSASHLGAVAAVATPVAAAAAQPAAAAAAASSSSAAPYVVVDDAVPDMGGVAWQSATAAAAAMAPEPGAQAEANGAGPEEDAEALARAARLQGFVAGNMVGGVGALEAMRAQQRK